MAKEKEFEIIEYFPAGFFKRENNEEFSMWLLSHIFGEKKWRRGNPDIKEPDWFCADEAFEITLACDRDVQESFIQKLMEGEYLSEDVEADILKYIIESVDVKANKNYCVENVNVFVLCTMEMYEWVDDILRPAEKHIEDTRKGLFFKLIKESYIDNGILENVYIGYPDRTTSWWVEDIKNGKVEKIQLTDEQIISGKFPYIIYKEALEN